MVLPVFAAIASVIAEIGIGTLIRYGFWSMISYFVYDVANDISSSYKISAEAEASRDKKADEVAENLVEDGTWTREQYLTYLGESDEIKKEEKGDIFDQISRSLGITKKTLIWVIVGIIAFSMLKG